MIIDSHVYCLPSRLRSVGARLPASEEAVKKAIYRHADGAAALRKASPEAIASSMNRCGIDVSVLVSLPWRSRNLCCENNHFILEAATDRRFLAVCSIQPAFKGWERDADELRDAGALALKVNPEWQGFDLDGPQMKRLAAWSGCSGCPLMVHVDHGFRTSRASAAHLINLCSQYPETRIIACHLGGMAGIYSLHRPLKAVFGNVWFDTAVSSTMEMVRFYVQSGLENKIIFGSDFPFNHCHSQSFVLKELRRLDLGRAVEEKILGETFTALIGGIGR